MREKIYRAITSDLEIPALPQSALRVQCMVDDPSTTAKDLASLISSDPALTSRLLRQANSKFYGYSRTIGTIPLAIVVLGYDTVREISLSVSALMLAQSAFAQSLLNVDRFWSHSLAVAVSSKIISKRWHIGLAGESFVVGLLHDLGRLILASYWNEQYKSIIANSMSGTKQHFEVEREELGTDHAEVASWLFERWNLPDKLIKAALQVHLKVDNNTSELARIVILADWLAHRNGFRHDFNAPFLPEPEYITQNLPNYDELELRAECRESYRQAMGILETILDKTES
ncbi:HDOD domain-containing protein [Calditrichota bacterium]